MKKKTVVLVTLLSFIVTVLLCGCQKLAMSDKANVSKADVSQSVFAQFKEEGFSSLEEAEKAAVDMFVKKDYKAMVDHSTAGSMIEGAFDYDGSTEFYEYFTQYLKSRFGDDRGKLVYNNPKLMQAFPAKDGMSGHYVYNFTNADNREFGTGFAIVNKNGKFLLDYTLSKYIFDNVFFKFNSGEEILHKLISDPQKPSNVLLPIALMKCADQEVTRPWKIWMAIASQHRMQMKSITFETDNGKFNVSTSTKMGPEGCIIWVESPKKFGKITKATVADQNGTTYEFKVLE